METLFAFGYSCTLRIGNEQLATSNDTNVTKRSNNTTLGTKCNTLCELFFDVQWYNV